MRGPLQRVQMQKDCNDVADRPAHQESDAPDANRPPHALFPSPWRSRRSTSGAEGQSFGQQPDRSAGRRASVVKSWWMVVALRRKTQLRLDEVAVQLARQHCTGMARSCGGRGVPQGNSMRLRRSASDSCRSCSHRQMNSLCLWTTRPIMKHCFRMNCLRG